MATKAAAGITGSRGAAVATLTAAPLKLVLVAGGTTWTAMPNSRVLLETRGTRDAQVGDRTDGTVAETLARVVDGESWRRMDPRIGLNLCLETIG